MLNEDAELLGTLNHNQLVEVEDQFLQTVIKI